MALNDELLTLNEKIKYYTFETFRNIPVHTGVYAWFYPLRLKGREIKSFLDEINLVFNFYQEDKEIKEAKVDVNMGWRKYTISTEFKNVKKSSSFIIEWEKLVIEAARTGNITELEELKKIIFISSVFMPPLYIGKAKSLYDRCHQHIDGTLSDSNNFHNRFTNYASTHKFSCRNVEDLIFACISTNQFDINDGKYENLIEKILMNLIKPIYSIK